LYPESLILLVGFESLVDFLEQRFQLIFILVNISGKDQEGDSLERHTLLFHFELLAREHSRLRVPLIHQIIKELRLLVHDEVVDDLAPLAEGAPAHLEEVVVQEDVADLPLKWLH